MLLHCFRKLIQFKFAANVDKTRRQAIDAYASACAHKFTSLYFWMHQNLKDKKLQSNVIGRYKFIANITAHESMEQTEDHKHSRHLQA